MSMNSWEGEVDSMISGDAADAAAKGKGGKGKSGTGGGDNLFQGLMQVLGIGNKPMGTKMNKRAPSTLTSSPVMLLNSDYKPNEVNGEGIETPSFSPKAGLPMDSLGMPDLGKIGGKTDILSVALKAIGAGL
jgi:hypothetical protein